MTRWFGFPWSARSRWWLSSWLGVGRLNLRDQSTAAAVLLQAAAGELRGPPVPPGTRQRVQARRVLAAAQGELVLPAPVRWTPVDPKP